MPVERYVPVNIKASDGNIYLVDVPIGLEKIENLDALIVRNPSDQSIYLPDRNILAELRLSAAALSFMENVSDEDFKAANDIVDQIISETADQADDIYWAGIYTAMEQIFSHSITGVGLAFAAPTGGLGTLLSESIGISGLLVSRQEAFNNIETGHAVRFILDENFQKNAAFLKETIRSGHDFDKSFLETDSQNITLLKSDDILTAWLGHVDAQFTVRFLAELAEYFVNSLSGLVNGVDEAQLSIISTVADTYKNQVPDVLSSNIRILLDSAADKSIQDFHKYSALWNDWRGSSLPGETLNLFEERYRELTEQAIDDNLIYINENARLNSAFNKLNFLLNVDDLDNAIKKYDQSITNAQKVENLIFEVNKLIVDVFEKRLDDAILSDIQIELQRVIAESAALSGTPEQDVLIGSDDDDIILPGAGIDRITTGDGTDIIRGLITDIDGDEIIDLHIGDRIELLNIPRHFRTTSQEAVTVFADKVTADFDSDGATDLTINTSLPDGLGLTLGGSYISTIGDIIELEVKNIPLQISQSNDNVQAYDTRLTPLRNDNILVTWTERNVQSNEYYIKGHILDSDFLPIDEEFSLSNQSFADYRGGTYYNLIDLPGGEFGVSLFEIQDDDLSSHVLRKFTEFGREYDEFSLNLHYDELTGRNSFTYSPISSWEDGYILSTGAGSGWHLGRWWNGRKFVTWETGNPSDASIVRYSYSQNSASWDNSSIKLSSSIDWDLITSSESRDWISRSYYGSFPSEDDYIDVFLNFREIGNIGNGVRFFPSENDSHRFGRLNLDSQGSRDIDNSHFSINNYARHTSGHAVFDINGSVSTPIFDVSSDNDFGQYDKILGSIVLQNNKLASVINNTRADGSLDIGVYVQVRDREGHKVSDPFYIGLPDSADSKFIRSVFSIDDESISILQHQYGRISQLDQYKSYIKTYSQSGQLMWEDSVDGPLLNPNTITPLNGNSVAAVTNMTAEEIQWLEPGYVVRILNSEAHSDLSYRIGPDIFDNYSSYWSSYYYRHYWMQNIDLVDLGNNKIGISWLDYDTFANRYWYHRTPQDAGIYTTVLDLVTEHAAPEISLSRTSLTVKETSSTDRTFLAHIVISDDDVFGSITVEIAEEDRAYFEIEDRALYLKEGVSLTDFDSPLLAVKITVDDDTIISTQDYDGAAFFWLAIEPYNEAPQIDFRDTGAAVPENHRFEEPLKVADIIIDDDQEGYNTIQLRSGGSLFQIIGDGLYVREGARFDFEAISTHTATVRVFDRSADDDQRSDTASFTISVTDVNEAPRVEFENVVTLLSETSDTSSAIRLADIAVTDDALGENKLSLTGADADLVQIVGEQLQLKPSTILDFETNPRLSINVLVDDPELGIAHEDSDFLSISIKNELEIPDIQFGDGANGGGAVQVREGTSQSVLICTVEIGPVSASDQRDIDIVVVGSDADSFIVNDGSVFLKHGLDLDYETQAELNFTINIVDSGNANSIIASHDCAVEILDLVEPAFGAAIVVDTVVDESDGDYSVGDLSLREAVELANINSDHNDIIFAPELSGRTINLTGGRLNLTSEMTITGLTNSTGAPAITIDAGDNGDAFYTQNEFATFERIDDAWVLTSDALQIQIANLELTGAARQPEIDDRANGVGITVQGGTHLNASNLHIHSNQEGGVVVYGDATIVDSIIEKNSGSGIHTNGNLIVRRSLITKNNENDGGRNGGGINANLGSDTLITDSEISYNYADFAAGIVFYGESLTIERSSIIYNKAQYFNGDGNLQLGSVGGIYLGGGPADIKDSVIRGNTADWAGGVRVQLHDNSEAEPGRQFHNIIENSSIIENEATYGAGLDNGGQLLLKNSTIAGNTSNFVGGGLIYQDYQPEERPGTSFRIVNSTISDNQAQNTIGFDTFLTSFGAGIFFTGSALVDRPGNISLLNSVVAGNVGGEFGDWSGNTGVPTELLASHNFIGGNPRLGPLKDNGGIGLTLKPLPGSPLIDQASNTIASQHGLVSDQRGDGYERKKNGQVDIGAVEFSYGATNSDDVFYLPPGNNRINGGAGDDTVVIDVSDSEAANITIAERPGGSGEVELVAFDIFGNIIGIQILKDVEEVELIGTDGADEIIISNLSNTDISENTVILHAGDGDDTIDGLQAERTLDVDAGHGDDTVIGGSYGDVLRGGHGNDFIQGNGGDDQLDGGEGEDNALYFGLMQDYIINVLETDQLQIIDQFADDEDDGADLLVNFEYILFADGFIDLTSSDSMAVAVEEAFNVQNPYEIVSVGGAQAEGTSEGATPFKFQVTRKINLDTEDSILAVVNLGTTVQEDYADDFEFIIPIEFASGESVAEISVPILADDLPENDETFSVGILSAGLEPSSLNIAEAIILDDDPLNNRPIAEDDSFHILEDMPLNGDVAQNDNDVDGDALTFEKTQGPVSGTLEFFGDGSFVYTPEANFHGTDSFGYKVSDGNLTNTATVTIEIDPVDAVLDIFPKDADKAETDAGPQPFTFTVTRSEDLGGAVSVDYVVIPSGADPAEPNDLINRFNGGTISFADGEETQSIAVDVFGDVHVENDEQFTVKLVNPSEATIGTSSADGIIRDNDSILPDDNALSGSLIGQSIRITQFYPSLRKLAIWSEPQVIEVGDGVEFEEPNFGRFTIDFTEDRILIDYVEDVIRTRYQDQEGKWAERPFNGFVIEDINNGMRAIESVSISDRTDFLIGYEGDVTWSSNAVFVNWQGRSFMPTSSFALDITFAEGDDSGLENVAPVAMDDATSGLQNSPIAGNVLGNDQDPGDTLSVNVVPVTGPTRGTVSLMSNGDFTYTPDTDYGGTDTFTYSVEDGGGLTDTATVTITINADDASSLDLRFFLVDAETETDLRELTGSDVINRAFLSDGRFNIRVEVEGTEYDESVQFFLNGELRQTENLEPYAVFSDDRAGDYRDDTLGEGPFSLLAKVFDSNGGGGSVIYEETLSFEVVDSAAEPEPEPEPESEPEGPDLRFFLIDAGSDAEVRELNDGDTINRDELSNERFNIRVNVEGTEDDESIQFFIDGNLLQTENLEPYAVFSDDRAGDYRNDNLGDDTYSLNAKVWDSNGGSGTLLFEETLDLTVVEIA